MSLTTKVLLGLVLGLAVGVFLSPADAGIPSTVVAWIEPVGALWVNAIRMTVIPLLVSLLLAGIVSAGTKTVAGIGGRAVAWFAGMIAVSSAIGAVFAPPLLALLGTDAVQLPEVAAGAASIEVALPPFRNWFVGLLPSNPVAAAAEGAILPLVLFTAVFGLAATRIDDEPRQRIVRGSQAVADTMFVIIEWILAAAPPCWSKVCRPAMRSRGSVRFPHLAVLIAVVAWIPGTVARAQATEAIPLEEVPDRAEVTRSEM